MCDKHAPQAADASQGGSRRRCVWELGQASHCPLVGVACRCLPCASWWNGSPAAGGLEDSAGQLDASLAAADLVICQTGCISHHAYWRVKDHCKRTGKRCIFVDNPSVSSLVRGLQEAAL